MKLNNKGMSLMELLVSIVLIGIVLTFLFQLLVDVKNETGNNDYAYSNQVNRTEAIYTIQKDLSENILLGIEDKSSSGKFAIYFYYLKGDETKNTVLTSDYKESEDGLSTAYYLRYTDINGEKYSWEMKGAEIDPCGNFTYYYDSITNHYYFKLNIYLYNSVFHPRNNKDGENVNGINTVNNKVDDIEITYAADGIDLITTNGAYLTNSTNGDKQIGTCTE